ncbi:MAG: hypothetical protein NVSMB16_04190 [Acidimicrobiales bacterium]
MDNRTSRQGDGDGPRTGRKDARRKGDGARRRRYRRAPVVAHRGPPVGGPSRGGCPQRVFGPGPGRFHACLDVLPDAIAILDAIRAPGGEINEFQVRYLNRAAETIFPAAMLESASVGGARQFMSDQTFGLMTEVVDRAVTQTERTTTEFESVTLTVEYTGATVRRRHRAGSPQRHRAGRGPEPSGLGGQP